MRMRWLVLAALVWACPAWGVDLASSTAVKIPLLVHDKRDAGVSGLSTSNFVLQAWCEGDSSTTTVTMDALEPNIIGGPGAYLATINAIGAGVGTIGKSCLFWSSGSGSLLGRLATKHTEVTWVPLTIIGTVVSSADCTNSATLFDTTLPSFYSGTNGPREAGIRFLTGALANEPRRVGGYNTNGCVQVNQGFSGTPSPGDTFMVINQ